MDLTETTCYDVMLTQNDFTISHDIHIHDRPMSCKPYALEDNNQVLLRTTRSNHKIYHSRIQFCSLRGIGPCKSKPEFVKNGLKFCPVECLVSCFSDESKVKIG